MKTNFHERMSRSIVKAVMYRLLIITADTIVIYLVTRKLDLTLGLVAIMNFGNTILYFVHERIWNNIHWGKEKRKKA